MKIKVCGLTQPEQIQELIAAKIDYLGFIFYQKSPRYVLPHLSPEKIRTLQHQGKVGVFVNEEIKVIAELAEAADLQLIQLHGAEDRDFIRHLRRVLPVQTRIIKSVAVNFERNCNADHLHSATASDFSLFDTATAAHGGSGKRFPWNALKTSPSTKPYFLSGGISPDIVADLRTLGQKPYSLDINSKFENAPGDKNVQLIKEFKTEVDQLKLTKISENERL